MSASIDILSSLSGLDIFIFFFVLALTLAVVVFAPRAKDSNTLLGYLLMGRRLTLPLFVATLVATWYGGIFGVTQIAFNQGIYNFFTQGVFWYFSYFLFAWFIVDKIKKPQFKTLPELISKTVGPKSGKLAALFNLANVLPISYVISLGILVSAIFPVNFLTAMILGTAFVSFYSFTGGFRAVVLSDVIQFTVMVTSVLLVLIFSISTFGGFDFLSSALPATHMQPLGTESLSSALVWGFIALSTLVDPNFYQRCFAASSIKTAKRGIYVSIAIWVVFDICTTAGGLYARALIPQADSSQAYMIYALQLLPDGLRGFFLAGILATVLSTIDSYLFIGSNTLSYDLFPKFFNSRISLHKLSIIGVALISIVLGNMFDGNIKAVWKTLGSYSAACLLFPVLMTYLFPRKISDGQFFGTVCVGTLAVTFHRMVQPLFDMDDFYVGIIFTTATLLCFVFLSRVKFLFSESRTHTVEPEASEVSDC